MKFLLLDLQDSEGSKDLTSSELEMLVDIINPESEESTKFWATALAVQALSNWGVAVSTWMHKCRCQHHTTEKERDECNLKGRCGVEMAMGAWKEFLEELSNLKLSHKAVQAVRHLDSGYAQKLMEWFQQCKHDMAFRGHQAWSFWDELPHNILTLGQHFLVESQSRSDAENKSRDKALKLLHLYDSCSDKASLGVVSWLVFSKHRQHILAWGGRKETMPPALQSLLMGYCSSLIVMQRLEGRHHLINLRVSKGRALLPAGLFADLRRARHPDLRLDEFRKALPDLMQDLSSLVPDSWQSQRELLKRVYGFGLDDLHQDVSAEQGVIDKAAAAIAQAQAPSKDPGRLVAWQVIYKYKVVALFHQQNLY